MSWLSSWWNNEPARDAAQRAQETAAAGNAATLASNQTAEKNNLDFQKVLSYLQTLQGNQTNAQQLGLSLSGAQQQQDQFAQLYNQDQTNNLPLRQAQLAGLSAMTPLMQMAGMQGYNPNTTLDTTKLVAPNVTSDFNKIADFYKAQGERNTDPAMLLRAMNDPAGFLSSLGGSNSTSATGGSASAPAPAYYPMTPINAGSRYVSFIPNPVAPTATANMVKTPPSQPVSTNSATLPAMSAQTASQTTNLTPYSGQAAGSQVTGTPGYQYRVQEAQRQMNNMLASQGLLGSGAGTMMAGNMGQQIAGTEYDNQYNRLMDLVKLGMGMQPTSQGTQAASQLGNIGQQGQQNVSEALQNAANGRSSMYTNLGSAYGNNQSNNAAALGQYYGANSGAANAYANSMAGNTSGIDKALSLAATYFGTKR